MGSVSRPNPSYPDYVPSILEVKAIALNMLAVQIEVEIRAQVRKARQGEGGFAAMLKTLRLQHYSFHVNLTQPHTPDAKYGTRYMRALLGEILGVGSASY